MKSLLAPVPSGAKNVQPLSPRARQFSMQTRALFQHSQLLKDARLRIPWQHQHPRVSKCEEGYEYVCKQRYGVGNGKAEIDRDQTHDRREDGASYNRHHQQ